MSNFSRKAYVSENFYACEIIEIFFIKKNNIVFYLYTTSANKMLRYIDSSRQYTQCIVGIRHEKWMRTRAILVQSFCFANMFMQRSVKIIVFGNL